MLPFADFVAAHATAIQAALFGTTIVIAWWFENERLGPDGGRKARRTLTNALFVLPGLPLQVLMAALCVQASVWCADTRWGLGFMLPYADSAWVKLGVMFFVLDFLDYLYHVVMHRVPFLWRFHSVHHTDDAIDVSSTVREHPAETITRNGFLLAWVLLTGASIEVLILRQSVQTVSNILSHTSFQLSPWPARVLGWLLITPNLHHVHHHHALPYTDRNFGDVFSVWDRLLGTFASLPKEKLVFGLDCVSSKTGEIGFGRALGLPFEGLLGGPSRDADGGSTDAAAAVAR